MNDKTINLTAEQKHARHIRLGILSGAVGCPVCEAAREAERPAEKTVDRMGRRMGRRKARKAKEKQ